MAAVAAPASPSSTTRYGGTPLHPPPPPPARLLTGRDRHTYHTLPLGSEKTPKKDRRKNRTAARVFLSQAAEPRCHAANRGRLPAPRHPPHLGPVPPPPLPLPSLPPPGPRCRHQRHVIRGVRHARLNERLPGYGCTCKPDTAKVKATTRTRVAAPRPKRRNDTRLLADSAATSGRRCTWPGQGTPPSPPSPPPPPNTPCRGAQQPRQAVVAERQPYLRPGSRAKKKRKTERPAWRGSLRVVTRGRGSIPQHYNTHSLSTPPQPPPTPPTPSRSNTRFVRGHLLRTVRRGRQTQTRGVARRHARNRTAAQCRRLGRGEGGPGRGVNKGNGEGGGGRRGWMGGETVRRN